MNNRQPCGFTTIYVGLKAKIFHIFLLKLAQHCIEYEIKNIKLTINKKSQI